jgi:hypothetical protein
MTAQVVYLLCALTSLVCAGLLTRSYLADRTRLSLWSSLCFVGLAVNNSLLFVDSVVTMPPGFALCRTGLAVASMALLIYGLVWEVH